MYQPTASQPTVNNITSSLLREQVSNNAMTDHGESRRSRHGMSYAAQVSLHLK